MEDKRISFLMDKSGDNTLCVDTADCRDSNDYTLVYSTPDLNAWREHTEVFTSDHIHTITITLSSYKEITLPNGKPYRMKIRPFHHSFVLLPLDNYSFALCDSWEGVHYMNCRRIALTKDGIIQRIESILDGSITNEDFNELFDDGNNWVDEIQRLQKNGIDTQTFSADSILQSLRNLDDFTKKVTINVYRDSVGGVGGLGETAKDGLEGPGKSGMGGKRTRRKRKRKRKRRKTKRRHYTYVTHP